MDTLKEPILETIRSELRRDDSSIRLSEVNYLKASIFSVLGREHCKEVVEKINL